MAKKKKIRDIMTKDPVCLSADASIRDAARMMQESDVGDVLVLQKGNGEIRGIVTDRDIVIRAIAKGLDTAKSKLEDILSGPPVTCSPDDDVRVAVKTMREHAIRRLPVTDHGKPIGVVSLGDLALSEDPESALGQISGAPPSH